MTPRVTSCCDVFGDCNQGRDCPLRMSDRVVKMEKFNGSRIGFATVPRQRIEITQDALFLQRALLAKKRPFDRSDVIVMAGGMAVIAFLIFARWKGWL